jgi:tetratricopeptide (TPR) repeat protein
LTKVTLSFIAKKTGRFTIPSITFYVGSKKYRSNSLELTIIKAPEVPKKLKESLKKKAKDIKDYLYLYCKVLSKRTEFYTGEEVPVEVGLYALNQLRFEFSYPELSGDVLLHDYSKINNDANFIPYTSSSRNIDNYSFNLYRTYTDIRTLKPGKLKLSATISGSAKIQQRGGWGWNSIPAKLTSKPIELTFKNLPDYTGDGVNLGLIGEWKVHFSLSKSTLKVGDMVTFKITVRGNGALDNLRVEELKIPGFRSYPPEVKKVNSLNGGDNIVTLEYVLIPNKSGKQSLKYTVATFSPTKKRYIENTFEKIFDIEKGSQDSGVNTVVTSGRPDIKVSNNKNKKKVRTSIFYLKHTPYGFINVPLLGNNMFTLITFIFLGVALIIVSILYLKHKKRFENDPLFQRKHTALKAKKELLKQIERAKEDEIEELIQTKVIPYLNDIIGMPPGTSSLELIEHLDNEELKSCLQSIGHSNFMPGTSRYSAVEIKTHLLNSLKIITLILFCFSPFSTFATSSFDKGEDAYNKGDFKQAITIYKGSLRKNQADPYLLYNLGNCYFQKEEYGKALLYFTRANRLAPTDSTILENLNFVRRKLFLKEVGNVEKLTDFFKNLRDILRPDQWLLLLSVIIFLSCAVIALRIIGRRKYTTVGLAILIALAILSIIACSTQYSSTYNPNIGVVISDNTPLYQLPSENNIEPNEHLKEGREVNVKESRQGWLHIMSDDLDGWVKKDSVIRYSDYNNNS